MGKDWRSRILSIQLLLLYPIQSATIFDFQKGWQACVSVGFIISGALLLNYTFIKDLIAIFQSRQPINELYKEYLWVLIVALMNICFFACFYHMFGISHNEEVILNDWYNSFYFSITTWTTLGYGDFAPVENLRIVASFEALMGYFYMAILVGLLLNISQYTMKPTDGKK